MSQETHSSPTTPTTSHADGVATHTYRLLRASMPILLLWLVVAMGLVWLESGLTHPMTSISAYYYTDAQPFFVAVLIGLGVLLIVIQGQTPWEDALMNSAGALAPLVALLPTPVKGKSNCVEAYCTAKVLRSENLAAAIPDNHDLIAFNLKVAIPIWLIVVLYLSLRAIRAWRSSGEETSLQGHRIPRTFSAALILVWGAVGLSLYMLTDESRTVFYARAHLASAGLMVTLLLCSIVAFTAWTSRAPWAEPAPTRWTDVWRIKRVVKNRFGVYFGLAVLLIAGCIVLVLLKPTGWDHAVLVIEAAALLPFVVYWIVLGYALGAHDEHLGRSLTAPAEPTAPERG